MTMKVYQPLDLVFNELRNFLAQNLGSTPVTGVVAGRIYLDTSTTPNILKYYNGSTWISILAAGTGDLVGPAASVDSEVMLFSGTTGKLAKRAAITGLAKLTAGVLSAAVSGTDYAPGTSGNATGLVKSTITTGALTTAAQGVDYWAPGGTDVGIADGGTGVSTLPSGLLKGAGVGAITAAVAGTDYLLPGGSGAALTGITESQVSGLVSDLAAKAPLASPALTGTPTAPTATGGTNNTQVATTAYVDAATAAIIASTNALVFKGAIDCSANPNYPAADAGWVYKVSVAGRIGGASGPVVEAGDSLTCTVDATAAGNHATVGGNWIITQANIDLVALAGAGLVQSGGVMAVGQGTGVVVNADDVAVDTSLVARYKSGLIGNGAASSFAVTHGLTLPSATGQHITVWDVAAAEQVYPGVVATSATVDTIDFGAYVPTSNQFRWELVG